MSKWRSAVLSAALLAGCAGMSEQDCRSTDWYQLGERDGLIYGLRPQIDRYAYQCGKHGVQPSEQDYMAGWVDGYGEWAIRVTHDSGGVSPQ